MEEKETQKAMKKTILQRSLWATLVWATVMLLWDGLEPGKFDVRESLLSTLVGAVVFFLCILALMTFTVKRSNKKTH